MHGVQPRVEAVVAQLAQVARRLVSCRHHVVEGILQRRLVIVRSLVLRAKQSWLFYPLSSCRILQRFEYLCEDKVPVPSTRQLGQSEF